LAETFTRHKISSPFWIDVGVNKEAGGMGEGSRGFDVQFDKTSA
jgi:hypothetical protein